MKILSAMALMALTIVVAAIYGPMLYKKLFFEHVEKTHLFYSPVTKKFVYTEKIVGPIPDEAHAVEEDHHAETAYRDEDGAWYARADFEKLLPFIYYKNMELWGLLPLELEGRTFDKKTMRDQRLVMELNAGDIYERKLQTPLWPLLESHPGQARLVFPEDRFRLTRDAMEFLNADFNSVDAALTKKFTRALKEKGFVFPARSVHGKFTVLKPFDEGVFLVDDDYSVFHVKRVNGEPVVVRTPVPQSIKTRSIKISENQRKLYYGLLLDGSGKVYLLAYGDYKLINIPMQDYDADRMDFKVIFNPLYRTAIYSDNDVVRALVMDRNFYPVARYEHRMSRSKKTLAHSVYAILFPFTISFANASGGALRFTAQGGDWRALFGMTGAFLCLAGWSWLRRRRFPRLVEAVLAFVAGIYGLLAIAVVGEE